MGSGLEWYSPKLLAVHTADDDQAQRVADALSEREQRGVLRNATGCTR